MAKSKSVWVLHEGCDYEGWNNVTHVWDHKPDFETEIFPALKDKYYDSYRVTEVPVIKKPKEAKSV